MEIKGKKLAPNKTVRVKSILVKDQGKTSFNEKKPAFFTMDETNNCWVVEVRDGKEFGRWNVNYIVHIEWLQE